MEITLSEFVYYNPSTAMPDASIFEAVQSMIDERLAEVEALITPRLFAQLDEMTMPIPTDDPRADRYIRLLNAVKGYVCTSAYYLSIPSLDLVLTSTGFGVVSNQNVVPASESRVRALREAVDRAASDFLESIIDLCRPLIKWRETQRGRDIFDTLFWRGAHLALLGKVHPTRRDIVEYLPQISLAAERLTQTLSPELYRKLLDVEATDSATPCQGQLISLWRRATVAWIRLDNGWSDFCSSMLGFVEGHIDEFPEYRDSRTCQANHFKPYQNEKDDSCYFFG